MMRNFKLLFFLIIFQVLLVFQTYAKIIDYIVAIIDNKQIITASELQSRLDLALEQYSNLYTAEKLESNLSLIKEKILNEMIAEKILLISADKAQIIVPAEEVEKNIEEFKNQFPSEEEFLSKLEEESLTLADLREQMESKIKIGRFMRLNVIKNIRISEEEIKTFYEKHKDAFWMPGQVKISQILIKDSGDSEAREKIEEIFQKLKDGEDFPSLAREYSQCPNASKGGDLGFVYIEQLQPQIKNALLELNVGEFTRPVLTSIGYHIIKLEARKLSQYAPIDEVKELIKKRLYDLKAEEAYEEWLKQAKKNIDVAIIASF